jgi:hypothetical protein
MQTTHYYDHSKRCHVVHCDPSRLKSKDELLDDARDLEGHLTHRILSADKLIARLLGELRMLDPKNSLFSMEDCSDDDMIFDNSIRFLNGFRVTNQARVTAWARIYGGNYSTLDGTDFEDDGIYDTVVVPENLREFFEIEMQEVVVEDS